MRRRRVGKSLRFEGEWWGILGWACGPTATRGWGCGLRWRGDAGMRYSPVYHVGRNWMVALFFDWDRARWADKVASQDVPRRAHRCGLVFFVEGDPHARTQTIAGEFG